MAYVLDAALFPPSGENTADAVLTRVARPVLPPGATADTSLPAAKPSVRHSFKRVVLIRHGQSTWNEFLVGKAKPSDAEDSKSGRKRMAFEAPIAGDEDATPGASSSSASVPKGSSTKKVWKGFSGSIKGVARQAVSGAKMVHQVDHPLSATGLAQARVLRRRLLAQLAGGQDVAPGEEKVLVAGGGSLTLAAAAACIVDCQHWYVSPYLRALQTAAFVLSPLYHRNQAALRMIVTPMANEIAVSKMCLDCHGKKGNVGLRVAVRAIGKLADLMYGKDDDDEALEWRDTETEPQSRGCPPERTREASPPSRSRQGSADQLAASSRWRVLKQEDQLRQEQRAERQTELAEVMATVCAMDYSEVEKVWWPDMDRMGKEREVLEDERVRALVTRLLQNEASVVGIVAHSYLFRRIMQLFSPKDPYLQEVLRAGLRNGAPADAQEDPLLDKVVNCGVLLLTLRYQEPAGCDGVNQPEIIEAQFMFESHMEGGAPESTLSPTEPAPSEASAENSDLLDLL